MLLHKLVPEKFQRSLRSKKCYFIQKTDTYELFDRGLRQYEEEINIVRLMRTLRYNCAVIDQILKERPLKKVYNR